MSSNLATFAEDSPSSNSRSTDLAGFEAEVAYLSSSSSALSVESALQSKAVSHLRA